jgi:6-phosphogluconolactonase (cycloisomerase 2 family)
MKSLSLTIILLLFFNLLPVNSRNKGLNKDSKEEQFCFVYVSVSKEKKIVIFKLDPIRETLDLIGEETLPGEPGSLCINPSHKTMYAALRSSRSVASLTYNRKTGLINFLKDTPVADNPVYISTDITGKFLFLPSY